MMCTLHGATDRSVISVLMRLGSTARWSAACSHCRFCQLGDTTLQALTSCNFESSGDSNPSSNQFRSSEMFWQKLMHHHPGVRTLTCQTEMPWHHAQIQQAFGRHHLHVQHPPDQVQLVGPTLKPKMKGSGTPSKTAMEVEEGPPIVKATRNSRTYKLIKLRNGLSALLIHDPQACEDDEEEDCDGGDMHVETDDDAQQKPAHFQYNCTGGDGSTSDGNPRLRFHPDEEGGSNGASLLSRRKQDKEPGQEISKNNAAAAMCVGVGSMADPPEVPGLAHFLEHMLFMGSTKFPDENEYDKFLSQHGGSSNAYTDQEFTCYHFEVRNRSLRDALERFSQFFISPLVKAEAMDREIQAIESEFVQAAGNDMNRLSQVQCHTAIPSHPFHRFAWGNRKSLQSEPTRKGIDMRAQLLELYHENYLAGRMKLAVLGGESLETLQKWVVELFDEIKSGGHGRLPIHCDGRIWVPNRLHRVAAGMERTLVTINWPLPCLESAYLSKPHEYYAHIIGHEGQGSLLSLLKSKGWGREITAGCGDNGLETNSMLFLFSVTITLTIHGAENIMEVIGFLYQYLKMLRSVGPQEWVFQEQKAISKLNFEYFEDPSQDEYAISLATNMHLYSEAHLIYGDYAHDIWNPDLVTSVLSRLTPDNMRVDLLLHQFNRTAADVQMEPWFETPFTVETIPADLLQHWDDPPSVDPALHMPVCNEFIPHDFTVFTSNEEEAVFKHPSCLIDSAALKVWHKHDRRFRAPRINACFSIIFCPATKQITDAVLAQIYLIRLTTELNETLYLADSAKLETSISLSGYRIELKMFGFSEKLPALARKIASHMKTLTSTELDFERTVEVLSEEYLRANEKPIDHAAYLSTEALSKRFWNIDLRRDCLQSLTFQDFTKFVANLFSKTYIECFLEGNVLKEQALSIAQIFKEALVTSPLPLEARPTNCVVKLPAGTSLLYKESCKCEYERNSVVQSYFQIGQDQGKESIRQRCLIDLFEDIIAEPYFNQLRTKEQLGYVVESDCSELHGVLGISFMVQSAKYSPAYLEGRINAFIMQIPQILTNMEEEQFQSHKESLIAAKQGMPTSLYEDSERYWEQIWNRRYLFDANKHEATELMQVSKKELINWCRRFLGPRSRLRRHLCLHVVGLNAQEGDVDDPIPETSTAGQVEARRTVLIECLDKFKKNQEVYPVKL